MEDFFKKIKIGVLNEHFDQLGGGTTHSFKLIEFLKQYYDLDIFLPKDAKDSFWMKKMLNLDTDGVSFYPYSKGVGKKYDYMFFNISHWKAEETNAFKKFMLVFFPQFFFPTHDYHLIANSEYTKENIVKRWTKKPEEISVIYPPIQTSQFKPTEKENIILHVSRMAKPRPEADKGHLQMIQAFKELRLKDWQLHFVGQVQDLEYVKNLKRQAGGYNILFHESLPFEALKKLYGKAKIYWHMTGISMPNEAGAQEHFGMSIVEAMSAGAIPISFNSGGPKEIIEDGKDGFLVNDVKELISTTLKIKNSQRMQIQMPKATMKKAKQFDEENIRKSFLSLVTKTDKVSIIILSHNNSEFTRKCVERLYEVTPEGFELILINNDSTDNTKDVINKIAEARENVKVFHSKENMGFAKANNKGLEMSSGEYICYLNNDTIPQWGWLEQMIDVLETQEDAGIVGARLYFEEKNGKWIIQHAGKKLLPDLHSKHIGRNLEDSEVPNKGIEEVELTTGACMLIRRELAKFDEIYKRGYYEDDDLCLRVREAGWAVYLNHDAKLIHYEGKTQDILKKKDMQEFSRITEENYKLFKKRWGDKIKDLPEVKKSSTIVREGKMIEGLEIGGGEKPMYPEFTQVDLRPVGSVKDVHDARLLPYSNNSVKAICASYLLQCLNKEGAEKALQEWRRVLVPGGKLEIYIPDIHKAIKNFISTNDEKHLKEIYGEQKHQLDYYKHAWTFKTLDALLGKLNYVRVMQGSPPEHRPDAISIVAYKANE